MSAEDVKLSVGLALEQVRSSCNKVNKLNMELQFERSERNRYIQDALSYIPISQMMKVTGMSRESLYRIKNMPRHDD